MTNQDAAPRASTPSAMLSVAEACARILADVRPLPPERVPLLDALGRVLATTVTAPLTLPAPPMISMATMRNVWLM